MLIKGAQIRDGSITDAKLATPAGRPTTANKNMAASVTTTDGSVACATALAFTPVVGSYILVEINGVGQALGDGDKLHDCYFSGDTGTTARAFSAIVATDVLYWNGSIAGFQLDATDKVSFQYNK